MIRIELKHIRKDGFFRFENSFNARYWRKGSQDKSTRKTWTYLKEELATRVDPNTKVYTKIEYIKPKRALDVFNLEYV